VITLNEASSTEKGVFAMGRFDNKVIVVAGGGGGTGAATCFRLGREGASVVVGDVDPAKAEAVTRRIGDAGGTAIAVEFDMADGESVRALVSTAFETFGRLDGLHNIAGNPSGHAGDLDVVSTDDATWYSQLGSHLLGYAHSCRAAIPLMLRNGGGSIINTSSASCRLAQPTRVAYAAAKSGVETLTRHIASAWGKQGIRCNAIAYGVVLTDNVRDALPPEFLEAALAETWSPRLGDPEDIAAVASFLLSDEAAWINGQVLDVNGGRLIG
jgi:NAD(P)-dependent dehydrogenase (short-subunit alcohol dehydrogenase family)